ncbi:MAG: hypothetical protein JEZ10_04605 [Verrucomicrobia bacterium]|nr:hypothetical protein [Verrucomicrobiota bacterium]
MSDKTFRGNASQFFVAGELCRRGYPAVVTLGNCPNTDIFCSNRDATRFAHIQVKTFVPGNGTCTVGMKAEKDFGCNFFWVLAGIPTVNQQAAHEYYIIPSKVMSKNIIEGHKIWIETPGKKGQKHNPSNVRAVHLPPRVSLNGWDISKYLNRWDIIEKVLNS